MDYFAGLDISMDETRVCVLDREGVVVHESKTASTAEAIAGQLAKAPDLPSYRRDGTDGPGSLSRLEPARFARHLRREPAGISSAQVARDSQDRLQEA
jgi:hypothetical protein